MRSRPSPGVLEVARSVRASEQAPEAPATESLKLVESLDRRLNSFVQVRADIGVTNRSGPLAGVPIGVKDMFIDGDRLPTAGSNLRPSMAVGSARVLAKLRAAGAAIVGYTNLHEWAVGMTSATTATGPVLNPLNERLIPGGSSGGSAAALAAGLVAGAVGTDAGGSIRCPAACCGVVGFKPTFGLVDAAGSMYEDSPINHVGPMARSVTDVRALLEVMSGRALGTPGVAELRIGLARPFFFEDLHPEVSNACEEAIAVMSKLVADVRVVELGGARDAAPALSRIALSHAARLIGDVENRGTELQPDTYRLVRWGARLAPWEIERAAATKRHLEAAWEEVFATVDVVVTPTLPAPPPEITAPMVELPSGELVADKAFLRSCAPMNLGGVPCLSVPCGRSSDGGGIALSLSARRGDDATVLSLGEAFERATEYAYSGLVAD